MSIEEREMYINECVKMTAELQDVDERIVSRLQFEMLEDDDLLKEWDWLYDLCYLK